MYDLTDVRSQDGISGNLVEMDDYQSQDGDSGGPVYWGDTAYGLHQGWVWDNFVQRIKHEVFSRADYIHEALEGVHIAID